jgi:hypothetical protein
MSYRFIEVMTNEYSMFFLLAQVPFSQTLINNVHGQKWFFVGVLSKMERGKMKE